MIQVMNDNNQLISAKFDALNYSACQGDPTHTIIQTAYNTFDYVSLSGFNIAVDSGAAIVCGYTVLMDEQQYVEVPANGVFYVCLEVDLSKPAGKEGNLIAKTTITQNNLLSSSSGVYDVPLWEVTTDANGIYAFKDIRYEKESYYSSNNIVYTKNELSKGSKLIVGDTQEVVYNNKKELNVEVDTGMRHWDGRKIYSYTAEFSGEIPADKWVARSLPSDVDRKSVHFDANNTFYRIRSVHYPMNYYENSSYKFLVIYNVETNNVQIRVGNSMGNSIGYVTALYCKNK